MQREEAAREALLVRPLLLLLLHSASEFAPRCAERRVHTTSARATQRLQHASAALIQRRCHAFVLRVRLYRLHLAREFVRAIPVEELATVGEPLRPHPSVGLVMGAVSAT